MAQLAPRVTNSTLYPIAVLIDELRHEDVQTRLNSVQQLEHVALALGPERTRKELIPFLIECSDENDVVLAATAEQLGHMVDAVGGPEFASFLLRPLEDLLSLDESTVREKALVSIKTVMTRMPTRHIEEHCMQLVFRLVRSDWYMSRISACLLMAEVAHRAAFNEELLRVFIELCADDTPMVRRSALSVIALLAKETPVHKQRDLLDALRLLARDDQESVRILTIPTAMELARDVFPNPQESFTALFPEIRSCVDDSSWRVRVTVCLAIGDIFTYTTPSKNQAQVLDLFNRLLVDSETEVRVMAISQLPTVAKIKPDRTFINLITPSLNKLLKDDVENVRAALAEALTKSSVCFGPTLTADSLFHFILKFLRDISPAVRLRVIAHIECISNLLKLEEMVPCLLPAITELATDRQWRMRMALLEEVPNLAKHLGPRTFVQDILPIVMRWLCDPVFKVREAAAGQVSKLATILGNDLAQYHLIPAVIELANNSNYLYRLTAIMAISAMLDDHPSYMRQLVAILASLSTDSVANVRFNVARTLKRSDWGSVQVLGILRPMSNDVDADVKFYAREALEFVASQ